MCEYCEKSEWVSDLAEARDQNGQPFTVDSFVPDSEFNAELTLEQKVAVMWGDVRIHALHYRKGGVAHRAYLMVDRALDGFDLDYALEAMTRHLGYTVRARLVAPAGNKATLVGDSKPELVRVVPQDAKAEALVNEMTSAVRKARQGGVYEEASNG